MVMLFMCMLPATARAAGDKFDVDGLIQRVIEAHGGRQAILDASSVHAVGRIGGVRGYGSYEYWLAREGRRLWLETRYPDSSERRLLIGTKGYRGDGGAMEQVDGERYLAMVYQFKHLDLLHGLLGGAYKIRYRGTHNAVGATVHVLMLDDREGPPMMIYVNTKTNLIIGASGFFSIKGREADLTVQLYDYMRVKGLMLPHKIVNMAGGKNISETMIGSYELNQKIPKGLFTRPK